MPTTLLRLLSFILVLAVLSFFLLSCNYSRESKSSSSGEGSVEILKISGDGSVTLKMSDGKTKTITKEQIDFPLVQKVFTEPYCTQCHSSGTSKGGINLSTLAGTMKITQPTKPENSPLFQSVQSKRMPPRPPSPSPNELLLVKLWIEAGAKEKASSPPNNPRDSSPQNQSQSDIRLKEMSFRGLRDAVLTPFCLNCHSGNLAREKGIDDFSTYAGVLRIVRVDDVFGSTFYRSVRQDRMPPTNLTYPTKFYALEAIAKWISSGAPEYESDPQPIPDKKYPVPELKELSFKGITDALLHKDCNSCHNGRKASSFLTYDAFISKKARINIDDFRKSSLYQSAAAEGHVQQMPPDGFPTEPYKKAALKVIQEWLQDGAREKVGGAQHKPKSGPRLPQLKEVSFKGISDALLNKHCNNCHKIAAIGDFTSFEKILAKPGRINLKKPKDSLIYKKIAGTQKKGGAMPPANGFSNIDFKNAALKVVEKWIAAGAPESEEKK